MKKHQNMYDKLLVIADVWIVLAFRMLKNPFFIMMRFSY